MDENDELIATLPIHYSDALAPNIHLHQFPLLTRPLQAPPSAVAAGKRVTARHKPQNGRMEIHVPIDTRPEVYNPERAKQFGAARAEDDREKNQSGKAKGREDEEPRLSEVRLRSDKVVERGVPVLGIVRDGTLHLHPISDTLQFRPTLTYLDLLSRKTRHSRGNDSDDDSDDGPPPDPDEAPPPPVKKEKKSTGEAKEVQVTTRRNDDSGFGAQTGLSAVRREMLHLIRSEEEENWEDYTFHDVTTAESATAFDALFSKSEEPLQCSSDLSTFITSIPGLEYS